MVSLVLLAILRAEQVTARHGARTGGWSRTAKWFTLAATYVMNTWQAYAAGSPALVVLHSVPPMVVFVATEAVTDLRDTLGQVLTAGFMNAPTETGTPAPPAGPPAQRTTIVTPAWVREVTGCSRGLSSRLAATLRAEAAVSGTGVGA
jgi:hypothetical protein